MTIKKHINVLNYFSRDVPKVNSSKKEKNMGI
jgi:hypothetical protein